MPNPKSGDQPLHPKRRDNPKAKRPKATRADVDMLLEAAWAQGAWIERGANQHFKVYPADGAKRMIPIPATPSDWRTIKNKRTQLRREGIDPGFKK